MNQIKQNDKGFQQSGWAVAIPCMLLATSMFIYNADRLLECWKIQSEQNHAIAARVAFAGRALEAAAVTQRRKELSQQPQQRSAADDDDENENDEKKNRESQRNCFTPALLTYPELARRSLGPYAKLVDFGIAAMQYGVCLSYLIFVPQNLQQCTYYYYSAYSVPRPIFLLAMVLVELPLAWLTDLRQLASTNVVATLLTAWGLCAVLVMAGMAAVQPDNNIGAAAAADVAASSSSSSLSLSSSSSSWAMVTNLQSAPAITDAWFLFIGTSFFMMEGSMTLVVPLQEAVFLPKDRDLFPRTNAVVTSWIVIFYIGFTLVCLAGFGHGIHTALTASLTGPVAALVQLAYSIAVIMTFPLQAFPAMQVTLTAVMGKNKASCPSLERSMVASLIVVMLGVVALVALDYLGNVVSILGSLFGIPLALVYPPLMHNIMVQNSSRARRRANYAVVVMGFVAMAAASYATIVNWQNNAEGQ
jgi:solute carrier family 36 (proton-coupled amino acid transporter)